MRLPRLYVNGAFARLIHPISLSITQSITPLDIASITLPIGEELPARSYVELFTPYGSACMFRVRNPRDAYGQETTTAELEHMISEVGDYVVKDEISEMLPANTAMQRIFSHYGGNKWQLGTVSALGSGLIACEANHDRVLDDMLAILEQKKDCMMAFDFTTSPWTVKIVKKDTTVTAEGRLARNITSAVIGYDDTELCTRVWYQTFNDNEGTWAYKDADTKSMYGIVEGTVRTSSDMTASEITATVNAYLNDHKNPRISVSIQADEVAQITGESIDTFKIGKLMRLNLPEYGVTVEEPITSVSWDDIYGNPRSVTLNLGAEEDTVITFLHNLDAKGAGGGGGGGARDKQEEEWKEYYTDFQKTDKYISGLAVRQDKQGNILEQAGLELNSRGVLIYAETANGLKHQFDVLNDSFTSAITSSETKTNSKITQLSNNINLKVENVEKGLQSQIDIQEDKITAQSAEIALKANRIELDGYVKATDITSDYLYAKITALGNVSVGSLTSARGGISVNSVSTTSLTQGGVSIYLPSGIKSINLTKSGDNYTLSSTTYAGSTSSWSFSRATTLTGAWASGVYTVTASPQGQEIKSGGLTVASGQAYRSGDLLYVPIYSGSTSTGYTAWINWKNRLTSHSNCVNGVTRYSSSQMTLYYKGSDDDYYSAGNHYWYYKNSNQSPTTYYD